MTECPNFSVILPVYQGDKPLYFREAVESVTSQTVPPDELVIVADGPLTDELDAELKEITTKDSIFTEVVRLPENRGLGVALSAGMTACSHDWVARMDADDYAVPNRFEQQLIAISENPDIDVIGGFVGEFTDDPAKVEQIRAVPTTPEAVRKAAGFRSPINHPTVLMRREAVLGAGNYRPYRHMQDYELWLRMLSQGYTISNLDSVLVKFRADDDLYERRGGLSYLRTEAKVLGDCYRTGSMSLPVLVANLAVRTPVRLVPSRLRAFVYQRLLRQ